MFALRQGPRVANDPKRTFALTYAYGRYVGWPAPRCSQSPASQGSSHLRRSRRLPEGQLSGAFSRAPVHLAGAAPGSPASNYFRERRYCKRCVPGFEDGRDGGRSPRRPGGHRAAPSPVDIDAAKRSRPSGAIAGLGAKQAIPYGCRSAFGRRGMRRGAAVVSGAALLAHSRRGGPPASLRPSRRQRPPVWQRRCGPAAIRRRQPVVDGWADRRPVRQASGQRAGGHPRIGRHNR